MKALIKSVIPPVLWDGARRALFAAKAFFDVEYRYGPFSILLPGDHLLPVYQKNNPGYDKFLPVLASCMPAGSSVIDVGANCGDTLAAMVASNSGARYLCIEPDDRFFGYLSKNVDRIKSGVPLVDVTIIKSLVGLEVKSAELAGAGGTKRAVLGQGGVSSRTLDDIVAEHPGHAISLVKVDVDGFDYYVIGSGLSVLKEFSPVLFFECQCDFEYQKSGYENVFDDLVGIGYRFWVLFDNFGDVVLRTEDVGQVRQLMDYVWRQNIKQSTRTIYYFDILAASESGGGVIDSALEEYGRIRGVRS